MKYRINLKKLLVVVIGFHLCIVVVVVWFALSGLSQGSQKLDHLPDYVQEAFAMLSQGNQVSHSMIAEAQNHIFRQYAKYHSSVIDEMRRTADTFISPVISEKVKFVIFTPHEHSGFGNIAMGLVSTFIYALITKRVFLIDWKPGGYIGCRADLSELLASPVFEGIKLDWDLLRLPAHYQNTIFSRENRYHLEDTTRFDKSKELEVFLKCAPSFLSKSFVSSFNSLKIINAKVQEVEGAQYYAALIFGDNRHYAPAFQVLFPYQSKTNREDPIYKVDIFGPISRWLLKLTDKLQDEFNKQYNLLFAKKIENPEETFVLGLQIRKNPRERLFYNTPVNAFWKSASNRIMELKGSKIKHVIVYVTTDFDPAFEIGQNWLLTQKANFDFLESIEVKRVEKPSKLNAYSRDREAVKHAMVEMWLLSTVDDMIVSEKSTFGHVAHGMKSHVPLVVRVENRKEPICSRAHSAEPWFHLRKRSNHISCNLQFLKRGV
jgi:hypothetical protein